MNFNRVFHYKPSIFFGNTHVSLFQKILSPPRISDHPPSHGSDPPALDNNLTFPDPPRRHDVFLPGGNVRKGWKSTGSILMFLKICKNHSAMLWNQTTWTNKLPLPTCQLVQKQPHLLAFQIVVSLKIFYRDIGSPMFQKPMPGFFWCQSQNDKEADV